MKEISTFLLRTSIIPQSEKNSCKLFLSIYLIMKNFQSNKIEDDDIIVVGETQIEGILYNDNENEVRDNIKVSEIREVLELVEENKQNNNKNIEKHAKKSIHDHQDNSQFQEKKKNIEESMIKYCLKYFTNANVLDINFNITTENYTISRRLYIPDYIDLNIFIHVINEIFEWEGRPWQIRIKNFKLSSSADVNEVLYETENTKKIYNIIDVKLNKLMLSKDERFSFIYDRLSEIWNVSCKVEFIHSVKDLIARKYKTEKDRNLAFKKIKSLFRPILIKGEGIYPPDDMGGQKTFKMLLKNRHDFSHEVIVRYLSFYKTLIGEEDSEDNGDDDNRNKLDINNRDLLEEYLSTDFDFIELQRSLGSIEFVKFYEKEANPSLKNKEKIAEIQSVHYDQEEEGEVEEYEEEEYEEENDEIEIKNRRDNHLDVKSIRERETEREERESKYENYINIQKEVNDKKSDKIRNSSKKYIRIETSESQKQDRNEEKKEVILTCESKRETVNYNLMVAETEIPKKKDILSIQENVSLNNREKNTRAKTSPSRNNN